MKFNREQFFTHYRRSFGALDQSQVDALNFLLDEIEQDGAWTDLRHVAYLLSTIKHETAQTYKPIKEYRAKAGSKGRANQDRYWLSGWMGRGYVQLTWKRNYERAKRELGVDFVASPDLVMQPEHSYAIAATGMRHGWFTGKSLLDYINSKKCDYINARRIINGTDKAELIAKYASTFEYILRSAVAAGEASDTGAAAPQEGAETSAAAAASVSPPSQTSEPEKAGEPAPDKPAKEGEAVVGGRPQDAPEGSAVIEKRDASVMSRVTAALAPVTTFATAVGLKIGGVQLTNGVIIALCCLLAIGLIVGAFIYERSKQRAHEKTLFIAKNRAASDSYNVEIR